MSNPRTVRRAVVLAALLLIAACAGGGSLAPPVPQRFATDQVALGAGLAKLGDCQGCHTAEGGPAYAGGRPLPTPFGAIYATNITPDARTGLGRYSRAAFVRAMRQG